MKLQDKTPSIFNAGIIRVSYLLLMLSLVLHSHYRAFLEIGSDILRNQNISSYEDRFTALNIYIRSLKLTEAGYFTDCINDDINTARLYITQYALAPLIVRNNADMPYVIGNFCDTSMTSNMIPTHYLSLLHDFGKGVKLFRKAQIK